MVAGRRFTRSFLFTVGGIIVLTLAVVVTSLSCSRPTSLDDARLQTLQSDPIYSIRYPNRTELSRVERGSRGFTMGTEDPPVVMYYAGTNNSDAEIIRFFIDQATSNGWYIFSGPKRMTNVDRVTVILHKDDVGSLFVKTFEPETLNRFLRGEKYPTTYSTIYQVKLQAKHLDQ